MTLQEYLIKEQQIEDSLNSIIIDNMPLWRIVRTAFRDRHLGINLKTVTPTIKIGSLLRNIMKSVCDLFKLKISRKKYSNVFLPHPRLFLVGKSYLERMADPFIDYSGIGDDYIILERHQNGIHRTPRYHGEKVVYLDLIDVLAVVLAILLKPIFKKKYKKQVETLYGLLDDHLQLNDESYKGMFYDMLISKVLLYHLTKPLINSIAPQNIFLATRDTYNYIISYAKEKNITTIELQHGVTIGETTLYSGVYDPKIDPDYFFTFGKANIGEHFSMPLERIKNIGFAYKNYLKDLGLSSYEKNVVLVISDLLVSEKLLNIILSLSQKYSEYEYHIRCHPLERLTKEQMDIIKKFDNVCVVPNTIESFCAITQYSSVIGENSTVMYEAMSLHKRVGRLNYGGLHVKETEFIHGGYIINSAEDFKNFMTHPYSDEKDSKEVYSDFDSNILRNLEIN